MHAWCAVTDLAGRAVTGGLDMAARDPYDSPLTSQLEPGDDAYGPAGHAVLEWSTDCVCWTERDAFAR